MEQKVNRKEYVFCCELIWGTVPVDVNWAINTPLYQQKSKEILAKYPKLDRDFFNKDNAEEHDKKN